MIKTIQDGDGQIYHTSGLFQNIKMINHKRDVIKVTKSNGEELESQTNYKIATIDFCIPNKLGEFSRINWYTPKEDVIMVGNFNDLIGEALKKITVFDSKKYFDETKPRIIFS